MPIQRQFDADFQSDDICSFLKDHKSPSYDAGFDHKAWDGDYEDTKQRKPLPNDTNNIRLHTAIMRKYVVYDRRTSLQVCTGRTITRVDHPLTFETYAVLLVKRGVEAAKRTVIEEAFKAYQPGKDEVDDVETALVQKQIPISAYQVLLSFKLTRHGNPTFETGHDDAFKSAATHPDTNAFRQIGVDEETCEITNLDLDKEDPDRTEVVDDPDKPSVGLSKVGKKLEKQQNCENLQPTHHRVGTLFQYPEWRIVWKMRDVRVGRCRIMRTKLPVLETRTRKKVLYSYVLSPPDVQRYLERVFINCMETSAIVGGLLLLVTGGNFVAAVAAFKISMAGCLTSHINDNMMKCVIPDLAILTEKGEWHEI